MAAKCIEYLAELARHNYVTPKSYLELLNIFSILIAQKKMELKTAKNRMKSGLDKVSPSRPWLAPSGSSCRVLAVFDAKGTQHFRLEPKVPQRVTSFSVKE